MIYDVNNFFYMLKYLAYTRHKIFVVTDCNVLIKCVKTLFRSNDVNIFKLTGSEVIGLGYSGKLGSPILWIKMVAPLVHCDGKVLLLST